MKFEKLGLKGAKGTVFTIGPDGTLFVTKGGKAKKLRKLSLPDTEEFLYFIDDDGDLAREFRPRPCAANPTKPASAKLRARELYEAIEALLFPPDRLQLADAGYVEDRDEIAQTYEIYEKEFARLVKQINHALGPGLKLERGEPAMVWSFRDRAVLLSMESHDTEFPAEIVLKALAADDPRIPRARGSRASSERDHSPDDASFVTTMRASSRGSERAKRGG
jgi:hypothetical protein